MNAQQTARYICEALLERKGRDIDVLQVEHLTTLTEYFVICTATSTTQVRALADSVEYHLKYDHDTVPHHVEGFESSSWILLDYGSVLVHIFVKGFGRRGRKHIRSLTDGAGACCAVCAEYWGLYH